LVETIIYEARRFYLEGIQEYNSRLSMEGHTAQVFIVNPLVEFPVDRPIVIMDATPNKVAYEKMFPNREVLMPPDRYLFDPRTRTTVITGSEFSVTNLDISVAKLEAQHGDFSRLDKLSGGDDARFAQLVGSSKKHDIAILIDSAVGISKVYGQTLIVTHKRVADFVRNSLTALGLNVAPKESTNSEIADADIDVRHFQSLRGLNHWKNYQAVVIAGTPRPPQDALERQLSAVYFDDPEPLDFSIDFVTTPYHGRQDGYKVRTLKDERAQPFVDQYEAAEAIQCAERIRLHTSLEAIHGKRAFFFTPRPIAYFVSNICSQQDVRFLFSSLLGHLKECLEEGVVGQRHIEKHLKIGAPNARKINRTLKVFPELTTENVCDTIRDNDDVMWMIVDNQPLKSIQAALQETEDE
jgi:hypothetical protein